MAGSAARLSASREIPADLPARPANQVSILNRVAILQGDSTQNSMRQRSHRKAWTGLPALPGARNGSTIMPSLKDRDLPPGRCRSTHNGILPASPVANPTAARVGTLGETMQAVQHAWEISYLDLLSIWGAADAGLAELYQPLLVSGVGVNMSVASGFKQSL